MLRVPRLPQGPYDALATRVCCRKASCGEGARLRVSVAFKRARLPLWRFICVCVSVCRCVAVDRGRCATLTTALPAPVPSGPPRELDIYLILIFLCVAD